MKTPCLVDNRFLIFIFSGGWWIGWFLKDLVRWCTAHFAILLTFVFFLWSALKRSDRWHFLRSEILETWKTLYNIFNTFFASNMFFVRIAILRKFPVPPFSLGSANRDEQSWASWMSIFHNFLTRIGTRWGCVAPTRYNILRFLNHHHPPNEAGNDRPGYFRHCGSEPP